MRQKSVHPELPSERIVKNIRRATRKRHSSEEKIRIVLDGFRGESSIAELCRREGIAKGLYYAWSKEFLEAGKRRLAGDTARAAEFHRVYVTNKGAKSTLCFSYTLPNRCSGEKPGGARGGASGSPPSCRNATRISSAILFRR